MAKKIQSLTDYNDFISENGVILPGERNPKDPVDDYINCSHYKIKRNEGLFYKCINCSMEFNLKSEKNIKNFESRIVW